MQTFEMTVQWIEEQSHVVPFANLLASHLSEGTVSIHRNSFVKPSLRPFTSQGLACVSGLLNLSYDNNHTSVNARCTFAIGANWHALRPALRCAETCVRGSNADGTIDIDWHRYNDGSFCYMLNDQWCDSIQSEFHENGKVAAQEFAAFYAVNNARWLLYHHLEGYRRKLPTWDDAWPQWQHGAEGRKEYRLWENQIQQN